MLLSRVALRLALCAGCSTIVLVSADVEAAKPKKSAAAEEKQGPKRVALVVTGPKAKELREVIADELGEDIELMSAKDSKAVKPDQEPDQYVAFAKKRKVDAILIGNVEKAGKDFVLTVEVRNGADGEVLGEMSVKGRTTAALQKKLAQELAVTLADPIAQARAPGKKAPKKKPEPPPEETAEDEPEPEPEPEPEAEEPAETEAEPDKEEEEPAEDEPSTPSKKSKHAGIELLLGLKGFTRNYEYTDNITAERTYELGGAPAIFLNLRLYPLAFMTDGFVSNIGLAGGFEQGFAINSKDSQGNELSTSSRQWFAGLRLRLPFSTHEAGVGVGYGQHTFRIDGDESVPDVKYGFARITVDGRFRFGKIVVGAELGPRLLLGAGQLAAIFPNATGGGFEATLYGGYSLTSNIDALVGLELRRYYLTLNPNRNSPPLIDGDVAIAGGAVDQYLGLWLGLAWQNAKTGL